MSTPKMSTSQNVNSHNVYSQNVNFTIFFSFRILSLLFCNWSLIRCPTASRYYGVRSCWHSLFDPLNHLLQLATHIQRQHRRNSHPSIPLSNSQILISSTEQCSSSFLGLKFPIHGASCGTCLSPLSSIGIKDSAGLWVTRVKLFLWY